MKKVTHCLSLPFSLAAFLVFTQSMTSAQTLFFDTFETDTSATWGVFGGSASATPDHTVLFAFDYSTNRFTRNGITSTIPPAPGGTGSKGVKLQVNKNDEVAEAAAVSIYPTGQNFSSEFSLRFDMWLNYNGPAFGGTGSTEFATFGINHVGDKVNWDSLVDLSDGVWFAVTGEGGAGNPPDYVTYRGDGVSPAIRETGAVGGLLDRDGDGIIEEELSSQPPTYPLIQIFPSPDYETPGVPGKQWVQVEIRQRTNETGAHVVTWLMNNYVIAEHANADLSGRTSGTIMLGNMDFFSSLANPRADNFVIYDNVRVVNLASVSRLPIVTLTTNDTLASEPADPGSVTISRHGDSAGPLAVNYRVSGSASNGVDFALLSGTVTLAAGQTTTNLLITPINDSTGEPTETISIVLLGSTNYDVYTNISAAVTLQDDLDVPIVSVSETRTNAYEMNLGRPGLVTVSMSNPSANTTSIGLSVGGTATSGTDYTAIASSVTIPAGETNAIVRISPINNNSMNPPRTVSVSVNPGTGYSLGATTNSLVTIRDDDFVELGALLYSENFDADPAPNWVVNPSSGDHPVDLSFDYSSVGIPPAPNTTNSTTRGAKLQANLSGGVFGGVSISPVDLNLTNDFVLRFDLWQSFNGPLPDGGSGSTQLSGGGVGTSGTRPQWPGASQDSVWFAASGDAGSSVDYRAYSSAAGTGYTPASGIYAAGTTGETRDAANALYYEFGRNEPPAEQTSLFPNQAGISFPGAPAFAWHDWVIQKKGNTVTWHLDGKLLATVNADATNFAGGNILLLHSDINTGSASDVNASQIAFGLFDNVRVYAIASAASQPNVTDIGVSGGNAVRIRFAGESADTAASFTLQSSGVATGGFADTTATITTVSPGLFELTIPMTADKQFFRIRR